MLSRHVLRMSPHSPQMPSVCSPVLSGASPTLVVLNCAVCKQKRKQSNKKQFAHLFLENENLSIPLVLVNNCVQRMCSHLGC